MRACSGGKRTESVEGDTGIVDNEVDALGVCIFQVLGQVFNAGFVCDVQVVVLDLRKAAICLQRFGLLQLRVLLKLLQRGLAPALVARCQVDEEGAIVERRFGVLDS